MASLRDIRKRIRSVQSSQKITKAMKLVAASKLRRAQDAIVSARPYAEQIGTLLARVAGRSMADSQGDMTLVHPLLQQRAGGKMVLVVVTSDRGSCGAFNSNIIRRAQRFLDENAERFESIEVATIGRKGRDYFKKRPHIRSVDYPDVFTALNFRRAGDITEAWIKQFAAGEVDSVMVVYNAFKSAMQQHVVVQDVLPVQPEAVSTAEKGGAEGVDYIYEPDRTQVLDTLIPRYLAVQLWRALLESAAAEQGARMTAMDAASNNARDLADALTLQYNRARQATITRDLMDIVGGAEALSGS
jgi:F-type H+-transporting ATPase subunit gamma